MTQHTNANSVRLLVLALVAVAATTAPSFAGHTVQIVNGTRTAMVALQARPSRGGPWQVGLLKQRSLGIQKQVEFAMPENKDCFYDLDARFEDGHRISKRHVDLCKSPTFLLTDF